MSPELIDKVHRFLFATEEEMSRARLRKDFVGRLLRLRAIYTYWNTHPHLAERDIVRHIRERWELGMSIAYEDVRIIKICLGNLNQCTQDYYRWLFLARTEEAFQMARDAGDSRAFAVALNALGKYTQLDKEQAERPDYSAIVPQTFEITTDPTAIGYQRIENLEGKIAAQLAKYRGTVIQEAEKKNE